MKLRSCIFGKRRGAEERNQHVYDKVKKKPIILYDEYAMTMVKRISNVPLVKLPILCKVMKPHVPAVRV